VTGRAFLAFAGRRVAGAAVTLLLTSFLVFGAVYLAPGSPIAFLVGRHSASPEQVAGIRAQYHLDDPLLSRYWDWLTSALHGDFGQSILFGQDVTTLIGPRIGTSLLLMAYAAVLAIGGGVALGLVAGLRRGIVDRLILLATSVGLAVPSFVAAIVLLYVFVVRLGWFPAFGSGSGLPDRLWHLTLPAISLALGSLALLARYTRTAIREEERREHVQTAIVRGLPRRTVVRRHVLRNGLIPVTTAAGVTVASMIVGVAIIERAFALDGLGAYLIQALGANDFPVVQAIVLLMAVGFITVNTVVDLLYVAIDPRVSLGKQP
jgi:peptide/nickel transport system permease protein